MKLKGQQLSPEPEPVETESLYQLELNPGLTDAEEEQAYDIVHWLKGDGPFYGIAGHMLITGPPRQGKGLFANMLAYRVQKLFKHKHTLRDDHPRALYGPYELFNEEIMMADIRRMAEVAKADLPDEEDATTVAKKKARQQLAEQWGSGEGKVKMKNAILLLDEYWRYVDKRRPMSPMLLGLSGNIKLWGHLDLMVIGIAQMVDDLDPHRILPYVNLEARCQWCDYKPNTAEVNLYRVKWSVSRQKLLPTDRPTRIFVDGARPREELGGKRLYDLYNSKAAPMYILRDGKKTKFEG